MGVEPMREAASTRASVGREEAIDPFFWNVVDVGGIAAIDDVRLAEELTMTGEETVGGRDPCQRGSRRAGIGRSSRG